MGCMVNEELVTDATSANTLLGAFYTRYYRLSICSALGNPARFAATALV